MASPVSLLAHLVADREGLPPADYQAINEHWEDQPRRAQEYQRIVVSALREALQELPNVLWNEIAQYLSPPALPPALQAQLQAKLQIESELSSLLMQQSMLAPALQSAAVDASNHLAYRLKARRQLAERVAELEAIHGPANTVGAPVPAVEPNMFTGAAPPAAASAASASSSVASPAPASAPAASSSRSFPSHAAPASQLPPKQAKAAGKQQKGGAVTGATASAPKPNRLLSTKWKQRTAETHGNHIRQLTTAPLKDDPPRILLLGDSMFERWLSTGSSLWSTELLERKWKAFNAGVGGDTVQNVMWRIQEEEQEGRQAAVEGNVAAPASEAAASSAAPASIPSAASSSSPSSSSSTSLLSHLPSVHTVFLFLSTNNLGDKCPEEHIVQALSTRVLPSLQGQLQGVERIVVYALTPRKDISPERIHRVNTLLQAELAAHHPHTVFSDDLSLSVHLEEHYEDHVHLNQPGYDKWWTILRRQLEEATNAHEERAAKEASVESKAK